MNDNKRTKRNQGKQLTIGLFTALLLLGTFVPVGSAIQDPTRIRYEPPADGDNDEGPSITVNLHEELDAAMICFTDSGCATTGDVCRGGLTAVQAEQLDIDCGSGQKKCRSWQQWEVEGEYNSGEGTVEFKVECGEGNDDTCEADSPGMACVGKNPVAKGLLGCFHSILSGDPGEIKGKCVDPANPEFAYEAVPWGTEFIAAEHVIINT